MANTAKAAPGGPVNDNRPAEKGHAERIVTYRFDGVKYTDADKMPDGGLCISLEVKPLSVDWEAIGTVLEESGFGPDMARHYVDKIVILIEDEEMARSIAKRLRRLG